MRSASHFHSQRWPWWALTSQSLILTPLGEYGEQVRESWLLPILLTTPSIFLEFWATFKISYFTCSLSRSLKGKIYIMFFVVKLLHDWIENKHGIIKWQLRNIWKTADKWLIYLIYAESKVKIRKDEKPNRRELWSKQEYKKKKNKLPRKKRKITKNQEEMSYLPGNKINANENNNGLWFLTMKTAKVQWQSWNIPNFSSKWTMTNWKRSVSAVLWAHSVTQLSEGQYDII